MDLLALVDRLEELVGNAQKMPIGSRAIVDRRRLLDIVDQMRIAIPQEVRDAQEMVAQREARRLETEEEARLVIARAEDRAARMVEQHELAVAARRRAEEIAHEAERRLEERIQQANSDIEQRVTESRRLAQQQMGAADEYARELLMRLDRQLQAFVRSVQSGIAQLQGVEQAAASALANEPLTVNGEPIPLRRDDTSSMSNRTIEALTSATGDLENLLRPRTPSLDAKPNERTTDDAPVIIDDFTIPELDDEPTRLRDDRDRR